MIRFKRADHIHICVPADKLEEAKQFYINIIGLQQKERPKQLDASKGYWFTIGDIELHIGVDEPVARVRRHTAFEVEDIEAARRQFNKYGVEIAEEPHIPGRERFAFIDPFGNRMELLQMIGE
ncbi:VOC family protein [soil metagenome]|jgi:predicted enzyme related to lactoylglutathione lyase